MRPRMAVSAAETRRGGGRAAGGRAALRRALAARVDGEIRFDPGTRAAYAHDSSNYQQPPIGAIEAGTGAHPRHLADLLPEDRDR